MAEGIDNDCPGQFCAEESCDPATGTDPDNAKRALSDVADCDRDCTSVRCGDNHVNAAAGEQCDPFWVYTGLPPSSAACDQDCTFPACGDNIFNDDAEVCDEGGNTDECDSDCTEPDCGDGHENPANGEECDDGNSIDTDSCVGNCRDATCGDDHVRAGVEECDDGNSDNDDDCVGNCQNAECGDGFEHAQDEECDDGNNDDGDGCEGDCTLP